jgi:hypothetical protein
MRFDEAPPGTAPSPNFSMIGIIAIDGLNEVEE